MISRGIEVNEVKASQVHLIIDAKYGDDPHVAPLNPNTISDLPKISALLTFCSLNMMFLSRNIHGINE